MLKELGQLAGVMRNMGKIKEEAERFQARLGEIHAEASSGGDMVTARVNGRMELQKLTLTEAALEMRDREMLEDLIVSATNQALAKVRELVHNEAKSMAESMGLPAGINIPGLS